MGCNFNSPQPERTGNTVQLLASTTMALHVSENLLCYKDTIQRSPLNQTPSHLQLLHFPLTHPSLYSPMSISYPVFHNLAGDDNMKTLASNKLSGLGLPDRCHRVL